LCVEQTFKVNNKYGPIFCMVFLEKMGFFEFEENFDVFVKFSGKADFLGPEKFFKVVAK
jgi:hypothetical protein